MNKPTQTTHGWTPDRRAKQAASIKRWAPWAQSTGPRTASGKARSARNALKHGRRALTLRLRASLLTHQGRLHEAAASLAARHASHNFANELLDDPAYRMVRGMLDDGFFLLTALAKIPIMQKPCFLGHGGANS